MQFARARIQERLAELEKHAQLRHLSPKKAPIDFTSNDYLGLAQKGVMLKPSVLQGHGSGGSRLLAGNSECMVAVESFLADFYGTEAALVFSSGYSANSGLIACIASRHDFILYDALVHASLRDGVELAPAKSAKFKHNDVTDLERHLSRLKERHPKGGIFVVIESLYSMDGDIAPLKDIASLCQRFDAALIVDEAHAGGVYGSKGSGLVSQESLSEQIFARIHTFGKACGIHGACVLGSAELIQYLVNTCRPFIYSTAPPESFFLLIKKAHEHVCAADEERNTLYELMYASTEIFREYGVNCISEDSQVRCVQIVGNTHCRNAAHSLQTAGFDVRAILSPTVPAGKERLRFCLHSFNSRSQVLQCVQRLAEFLHESS